jgi:vacuolar-type H+-ATPase subunit C/Vma6
MELLLRVEDRGYPADYLISRIRGKRTVLISDWTTLIFGGSPFEYLASSTYTGFVTERSPEGLWRDLMKEYRWVYLSMNRALLRIFRPFFLYCELRTIFICLRHIKAGKALKTGAVLFPSLLSEDMKRALKESCDTAAAARVIEKAFLDLSETFSGISEICDREGLRGFERELTVRYLVTTVRSGLHPLMKDFFARIIDARNIISLYKFLRLDPKTAPAFIPYGSIGESRFAGIIEKKDMLEIYGLAGTKDKGPGRSNIENTLYKNISVFLRKAGRDPLGAGPILDYLWRASIEVMNLSILFYCRDMEREAIMLELVH